MGDIPQSHPRRSSLLARQKLVDAAADGLLADSAMIAHGRGEDFDYLLGERTSNSARNAIHEASARLLAAEHPVISVNGNTVVLAGEDLIRVAAVVGCPIEVNLYYRTRERVTGLLERLSEQRASVAAGPAPKGWTGEWDRAVEGVRLLGEDADGRIEGLEGPRALCCADGIGSADVVLVPLEDGDRCEALIEMGKRSWSSTSIRSREHRGWPPSLSWTRSRGPRLLCSTKWSRAMHNQTTGTTKRS